nr:hypothetical protein [Metabacillus lacus]
MRIPALNDKTSHREIEAMFSSLKGIQQVRIEPLISTMLIKYDDKLLSRNVLLRYVSLFFQQTRFDPLDSLMVKLKPRFRSELFRSLVSGVLLFAAFLRKSTIRKPDAFEYIAVIATGYTVLSHGTNKINHPDVLTGIISLVSLGTGNMLYISMVTWAVNIIEIFYEVLKSNKMSYSIY